MRGVLDGGRKAVAMSCPERDGDRAGRPAGDPFLALTPREMEVLRRIAAGQNTATMVREMAVTTATLRTYVKNVLGKLGARSRLEAANLASRRIAPDPAGPDRDTAPFARLTPREREVLIQFTTGTGPGEVARHLHMAQKTVNTHLQKIRKKLGVHSTLEAVALARSQLVPADAAGTPGSGPGLAAPPPGPAPAGRPQMTSIRAARDLPVHNSGRSTVIWELPANACR
jgi:DNA-binding CsgD family transcriptional regulator